MFLFFYFQVIKSATWFRLVLAFLESSQESFIYNKCEYSISCFTIKLLYILREKSLAIYFDDSQLNFIVSLIYVDKRSRVR